MEDIDELKALRRYTREEVADLLGIPETWLKRWVTEDAVPHQRSGQPGPRQRGVWFTYDNILEIGGMLSGLMSDRQANSRAEGRSGTDAKTHGSAGPDPHIGRPSGTEFPPSEEPSEDLTRFLNLRSTRSA